MGFSSANVVLFAGGGSLCGIHVSSNEVSTDYLIFRASHSVSSTTDSGAAADFNTNKEVFRLYLSTMVQTHGGNFAIGNATVSISRDSVGSFTYWFPYPMRLRDGACVKLSSTRIPLMTVFYTKFD